MSGPQCCENPPVLSSTSGEGSVQELAGLQVYVNGPEDCKRAIILIHDAFGFEAPKFRKLADKVAAAGYFVLVPDFFYGDPLNLDDPKTDIQKWRMAHHPDKGCEDAKALCEALKSKGVSSIGAAGFCWGGMVVVRLAKFDCIQAAVILHPGPITEEEISEVKTPTAMLGAEIDEYCSADQLKHLRNILLEKSKVDSFVKIYPGCRHGWTVRYNSDDESAVKFAEEAHSDMINWFREYVK